MPARRFDIHKRHLRGPNCRSRAALVARFRVHVPKRYNPKKPRKTPLVLIFHGWGGDENEFLGSESVIREADRRGVILFAPRGLGSGAPDENFNSWSFLGLD